MSAEEVAALEAENAQLKARVKILERAHHGISERWSDTVREVGKLRQVASRDDGKLLELARRVIRGPVTEELVSDWFNSQKFEDTDGTGPMTIVWPGLHEWHREIVLKASQHFGSIEE